MKVIADHPPAEMYKAGLEIDCQCARCGSSCSDETCERCAGDDEWDEYDDDDDDEPMAHGCSDCRGRGVLNVCLSSPEFCQANALPGRENVKRGALEWFTYPEQRASE